MFKKIEYNHLWIHLIKMSSFTSIPTRRARHFGAGKGRLLKNGINKIKNVFKSKPKKIPDIIKDGKAGGFPKNKIAKDIAKEMAKQTAKAAVKTGLEVGAEYLANKYMAPGTARTKEAYQDAAVKAGLQMASKRLAKARARRKERSGHYPGGSSTRMASIYTYLMKRQRARKAKQSRGRTYVRTKYRTFGTGKKKKKKKGKKGKKGKKKKGKKKVKRSGKKGLKAMNITAKRAQFARMRDVFNI